jgi:putative hemolysin
MTFAVSLGPSDAGLLSAVFILLVFSALLALAETGLVRTSRARAQALADQHRRGARSLVRLVADPQHFLAPILLLVNMCQMIAATLFGVEADRIFGAYGVVGAAVIEILLFFVCAEAIPKQWAVRHSDRAALLSAPPVTAVAAFPPIRLVSRLLIGLANQLIPGGDDDDEPDITEDELLALADVALAEDVIERSERALISSIIEFGDTIVREVMSPRTDIVAVDGEVTIEAALERAMSTGLSRLPVYADSVDDIVGIAYARDLMRAIRDDRAQEAVRDVCRPATFVPETKRVAPLLREMQASQFHLAVVIDEYGGTAGLVTLEDLIEELVGEIADEFETAEPPIIPESADTYRVSAKMPVDEVNELLNLDLPIGDDFDTVGGLLLHLLGHVPRVGEEAIAGGHRLVAMRVQGRRIATIRIIRAEPSETDAAEVAS